MQTVQKSTVGKNALWTAYKDAGSLIRAEIQVELKKAGLFLHWHRVASKAGYDLHNAKAPLRDVFLKHMPGTAEMFGVDPIKPVPAKKQKPAISNQPSLFE